MPAPSTPRCLQVDVDHDDVDLVSGLLWGGGVTAIHELPLGRGRVRLVAGLDAQAESGVVRALAPRWTPDTFDADFDGWLDAWRPFARPVRVGRVIIHPPWETPDGVSGAASDPGAPDLWISIDPGRSFGQGSHVTTRLALEAIVAGVEPGCSVLDVGCGSGVLGITAACLGAAGVQAIDIDDEAVRVTEANAARNGVGDVVACSTTPVAEADGTFELVVANILAPVLVELAPAIAARVAPAGHVVLSGLLEEQRELVLDAYRPYLTLVDHAQDGDWTRLRLRP